VTSFSFFCALHVSIIHRDYEYVVSPLNIAPTGLIDKWPGNRGGLALGDAIGRNYAARMYPCWIVNIHVIRVLCRVRLSFRLINGILRGLIGSRGFRSGNLDIAGVAITTRRASSSTRSFETKIGSRKSGKA